MYQIIIIIDAVLQLLPKRTYIALNTGLHVSVRTSNWANPSLTVFVRLCVRVVGVVAAEGDVDWKIVKNLMGIVAFWCDRLLWGNAGNVLRFSC